MTNAMMHRDVHLCVSLTGAPQQRTGYIPLAVAGGSCQSEGWP